MGHGHIPTLVAAELTVPVTAVLLGAHRCGADGCFPAQPGSGNIIYSLLFSLLFPTSLFYTGNFG